MRKILMVVALVVVAVAAQVSTPVLAATQIVMENSRNVAALVHPVGYWSPYGYVVTCHWHYTYRGPIRVCR